MAKEKSSSPQSPEPAPLAMDKAPCEAGVKLAWMVKSFREHAGLSQEQVVQKTKIHPRMVDALEKGDFSLLPSQAHVRAFAVAITRLCNGDENAVMAAWRELKATQQPARELPKAPLAAAPASASAPAPVMQAVAAPKPESRPAAPKPSTSERPSNWIFRAGSATWLVWSGLALGVVMVLWLLSWLLPHKAVVAASPDSQPGVTAEPSPQLSQEPTKEMNTEKAQKSGEKEQVASAAEPTAATVNTSAKSDKGEEFILRARNHCWVVLAIDGQVQPLFVMFKDEKRFFHAHKKVVMMTSNVGGLRVWWQGENLGYLGVRGEPDNGLVFEVGQKYKHDASQAMAWPKDILKDFPQVAPTPAPVSRTAAVEGESSADAMGEQDGMGLGEVN